VPSLIRRAGRPIFCPLRQAIIFEALAEINEGRPVPQAQAFDFLRDELDVDIDTPEMKEVLRSLEEMGILGG